nr:hypothetical protein BaRGS_013439 [Batillaria attramentaria]
MTMQDLKQNKMLIHLGLSNCSLASLQDFLCWFPIGLLGLLASQGTPVPSEANVSMAILVLPLNSVLNPFLYNLNIILEKRRAAKEDRLLHDILNEM